MTGSYDEADIRNKIIGLGDTSIRKSYYPELQSRMNELEHAYAKQQALIDAIPDTLLIIDRGGNIVECHGWPERMGGAETCRENIQLGEILSERLKELFMSLEEKALISRRVEEFKFSVHGLEGDFYFEARAAACGDDSVLFIIRDITVKRQMEEKMKYMGSRDSMTGLYNRVYFEDLMREMEGREDIPLGIILCDVDGLKFVNDTLGFEAGDTLLRTAGEIISGAVGIDAVVARIGGDEFGVLLVGESRDRMHAICEKIDRRVDENNNDNNNIHLSLSSGCAHNGDGTKNIHSLFLEADNAMYRKKLLHSDSVRSSIVRTLSGALAARDFITEGHGERMEVLAACIAGEIGLSEAKINDIQLLAQFHDIGKVGIPDSILFKPGRLDSGEMEIMRKHSEIGHRIASSVPELAHIAHLVLLHHERWDGNGYPTGLKGIEIPLECRIIAIADAYDAMTCDRPYRQAMPVEDALEEMCRNAGSQFDPELTEIFLKSGCIRFECKMDA